MLTTYIIVAVIAYLLGSIPFGYILVRVFRGEDIRLTGSGNIGATNVARSGAKGLGILTLFLDAGKGFLAVAMVPLWMNHSVFLPRPGWELPAEMYFRASIAAFFAIVGHVFPVWLKFKGGKGVATAAGAFLALAPKSIVLVLIVFAAIVAIFRYVSLGSIVAAAIFPVAAYFLSNFSHPLLMPFVISSSLLIILKHHQNIRRLLAGTEHRFELKSSRP